MPAERWRLGQNPTPFRPIPELEEMRRKFDDEIVRPVMRAVWERIPEEAKAWSPPMEIMEKGDNVYIKVDLPGVKNEDIDVFVTEDELTIKGERKRENAKDAIYRRSEIAYGNFYRSVSLPAAIDTKTIEAVYEEGVLRLTLQRAAGSKPKKVAVAVKKGAS
jgi:HSP20 family protein